MAKERFKPIESARSDGQLYEILPATGPPKNRGIHDRTGFLLYPVPVFYHRQVRSHALGKYETCHECAKRIAYRLVAPPSDDAKLCVPRCVMPGLTANNFPHAEPGTTLAGSPQTRNLLQISGQPSSGKAPAESPAVSGLSLYSAYSASKCTTRID